MITTSEKGSKARIPALIVVLLLASVVEGLDFQLLSLVGPLMLTDLAVSKLALGSALSAGLIGMSLGALAGGWLGDRVGPKQVLLYAIGVFSIATALTGLAHAINTIVLLRGIAGFAIGASGPNAISLLMTWLPAPLRAKAIATQTIGVPAGGMAGALLLTAALPHWGWRGCFSRFGSLSLLLALAVLLFVPGGAQASPASAGPHSESVERPLTWRFLAGISVVFACSTYIAYACISWLPVLVTQGGLPLSLGLWSVLLFNCLALIVAVIGGFLMSRLSSRRLMLGAAIATTAGCLGLLGLLGPLRFGARLPQSLGVPLAATAVGGGCAMILAVAYVVLAQGFPAARRATGIGAGAFVGRFGGIASSYFGGVLLGRSSHESSAFFLTLFIALGGIFAGVLLIDRHVQPVKAATNRSGRVPDGHSRRSDVPV